MNGRMNELTLTNVVSLVADHRQGSTLPLYEAVPDLVLFPGTGLAVRVSEWQEG